MLIDNFDFLQFTNYTFEVLNGESIDGSPKGSEHGDDESSMCNLNEFNGCNGFEHLA